MRKIYLPLLVVFVVSLLPSGRTYAKPNQVNCGLLPSLDWNEARTQAFAIIYPGDYESLGQNLFALYGGGLDPEYAHFETWFETSLALPITIRIYPNQDYFACLNATVPALAPGVAHSHIGSREIVLIGETISTNTDEWLQNFFELFRFELGVLFGEQITSGKIPPGLLTAIGHYSQDPANTLQTLNLQRPEWLIPSQTWAELWEDPQTQVELRRELQSTSIVAYLVDVYGWPKFLGFLNDLRTSESYRKSLADSFGRDSGYLEEEWKQYYPLYFNGRYSAHVYYNYDLASRQKLVEAGAYEDAARELDEDILYLNRLQIQDKLATAQALREKAQIGLEASSLIDQSRNALQTGDYIRAVELVDQAQVKYTQLDNYRRLDEISAYRNQVQQILNLHQDLDQLKARVNAEQNPFLLAPQMVELGQKMANLGDLRGQTEILMMSNLLESRQRSQQIIASALGAVLVLILLALRILLLRQQAAPEAQL